MKKKTKAARTAPRTPRVPRNTSNPLDARSEGQWGPWSPRALRILRIACRVSHEEIAHESGCSTRTIASYESEGLDCRHPTEARARAIARVLCVPLKAMSAKRLRDLPGDVRLYERGGG